MPRSRSSPNGSVATAHDESMLATRLISAGILAPIVVAVALLGQPGVPSLGGPPPGGAVGLVAGRPPRLPGDGRADLAAGRRWLCAATGRGTGDGDRGRG